jgi:hypothetical protein
VCSSFAFKFDKFMFMLDEINKQKLDYNLNCNKEKGKIYVEEL